MNKKYIIKPSLTLCDWNNTMFLKNHHQDENIRKLQWPGPGRYQWPGHQSDPSAVSAATLENIWGLVSRSFSLKTSWSEAAAVVCTEPFAVRTVCTEWFNVQPRRTPCFNQKQTEQNIDRDQNSAPRSFSQFTTSHRMTLFQRHVTDIKSTETQRPGRDHDTPQGQSYGSPHTTKRYIKHQERPMKILKVKNVRFNESKSWDGQKNLSEPKWSDVRGWSGADRLLHQSEADMVFMVCSWCDVIYRTD